MHHPILIGFFGTFFLAFQLTAKPMQEEIFITTSERPWVTEAEFLLDASLHATELQTIVLELESIEKEKKHGAIRINTVRFLVKKAHDFSFCIPADEPHILHIRLKHNGRRTVINSHKGNDCHPVILQPGSYTLDIYHDARNVGIAGKKAFIHPSQKVRLLGELDSSLGQPDFIAITGPNGAYVTDAASTEKPFPLVAASSTVGPHEVFRLLPFQSNKGTKYNLKDGVGANIRYQMFTSNPRCAPENRLFLNHDNPNEACNFFSAQLLFNDEGDGQFNMVLNAWDLETHTKGGIILDGSNQLLYNLSDKSGVTMTWAYKGFDCTTDCDASVLPLQSGEVALYGECDFKGPAIIFQADTADLSVFDGAGAVGLGIGDNSVASIRVGPDTLAFLYENSNFGGNLEKFGTDVSCLDNSLIGSKTTSSLQIQSLSEYLVTTNGCQQCVLTGIDLSNDDFSNGDFTQSILIEADLTATILAGTVLKQTIFSDAILNQTDFSSSDLSCTQFAEANLTTATFTNSLFIEDFSCYLELTGATLDYQTFPVEKWRYFDLQGSNVKNVPELLSSVSNPLDLSGVILSNVDWLAGKQLDSANLGCYVNDNDSTTVCPASSGTSHCSTLQGTVLTSASLKNACLQNASMEGIFLSFSNLDGADLSGAQLEALTGGKVATLQGAFMRNVILSGANLTGVNASDISFYSVAGGTADATDMTAPGANFSGAYLALADFSGSTANLQSTLWTNAMLLGANFTQADLTTNTSGGVNSGTNTTFSGAYLQGTIFADALLEDVDFTNTYWDALGTGGKLNFLIPKGNLQFIDYWKGISLPECPPSVTYMSGNLPPMNVTDASNTCPDANPGPCDTVWDLPKLDISLAYYSSALPPAFPQDANVSANLQCSNSFSDPNPVDFCWITTNNPDLCTEN